MKKKKKRKLSISVDDASETSDNLPNTRQVYSEEDIAYTLLMSGGRVTQAADLLGSHHSTIQERIRNSKFLQTAISEATERNLDIAEDGLMRLVQQDDFKAIQFYLKTKGKARGFGDHKEVAHEVKGGIVVLPAQANSSKDWEEKAKLNQQKLLQDSIDAEFEEKENE